MLPLIGNLQTTDTISFAYVYEGNVTIPPREGRGIVRCNVYRPKDEGGIKWPVLVTYGPYGKNIHYSVFHASSFAEVPEEHHSPHSAWETPDPGYWTNQGYALVRADGVGLGQSPGVLNTMSRDTSLAFSDFIEWAAEQTWSSGKVGLLGISYYAGSRWRVAARKPKGLACIIPWEGMSDYYRDRCRHGGILSNTFIDFWWNRQYGRPGRATRGWGPDTIEGKLSEKLLLANCHDQNVENAQNHFLDDNYYASRDYNLADIDVPLLSVGNWGGIYCTFEVISKASSIPAPARSTCGERSVAESFLDAFLKDVDPEGWANGQPGKVGHRVRVGDVRYNDTSAEDAYPMRLHEDWPVPGTQYVKYYLTANRELLESVGSNSHESTSIKYDALGSLKSPEYVQFTSQPFISKREFTGHVVAHLNVSLEARTTVDGPSDIDLFVTLRHLDPRGRKILYTGTVGDPVPITKGWLRCSLRAVKTTSPKHTFWHPHGDYCSGDYAPLLAGKVYEVDVDIWSTNVLMQPGDRLILEVSSGDTQGAGLFEHNSTVDRDEITFAGINHIHFGPSTENWLLMPLIPA
ncbi:hypothetical protein LTR78_006755 [Recurvomyces mirabilis]|uniref:Xaa-Pro dipeptidyl-peptidase C-terminal domain-containing protein n=1 Tax=Recurvomyces mirabilis TaxID=574656 RepID=A0AAE1BZQ0_9PEZI|nr:hypothetical protein LTR78_006755 [Recurvomyces mirabilis]KAK5151356.1 hypothetical protein LTS14_009199 [Recurvomyces mirabilis]